MEEAGVDNPGLNSDYIVAEVLGVQRARLPLFWSNELSEDETVKINDLTLRRCNREPLQYLLGSWGFLDLEIEVDSNVLIPRPETEELVIELSGVLQKKFTII